MPSANALPRFFDRPEREGAAPLPGQEWHFEIPAVCCMALSRRLVGRVCQRRGRAFALGTADRDGAAVALAGSIAEEEALPLAALVMYRLKGDDLAARLFTGEIVSLELDEPQREVAVGVVELGVTVRRRERAKA